MKQVNHVCNVFCKLAIACDRFAVTSGGAVNAFEMKDLECMLKWHPRKAPSPTERSSETKSVVSCVEFITGCAVNCKGPPWIQLNMSVNQAVNLAGLCFQKLGENKDAQERQRLLQAFAAFADPCMPSGCIKRKVMEEILVGCWKS